MLAYVSYKAISSDKLFSIVAFNHEQIITSSTGGYLLTQESYMPRVANNLLSVNMSVLDDIINHIIDGEKFNPITIAEKRWSSILNDLELVSSDVERSASCKKSMCTELWSMLLSHGAPSWFITFVPADHKHPIALYLAGTSAKFDPIPLCDDDQYRLVADNPVSGAWFFHFIVTNFLKHVLGVGSNNKGYFGETNAYYGTVKRQGRCSVLLVFDGAGWLPESE